MIKYIYLDDEESGESYANAISGRNTSLEVIHQFPKKFGDQVQELKDYSYDGLILDLRLDIKVNENVRADYKAFAFAQEYRTLATDKKVKDIPIILITTDKKFASLYLKDNTSHDLIDYYFIKEEVAEQESIGNMLVDFARSYERLRNISVRGRKRLLEALSCDAVEYLDERCGSRYGVKKYPTHDYAGFIFKKIIQHPGALINENTLASRLGVDISNSSDWSKLLAALEQDCKYKGVFGYAWERWWASCVEKWWKETVESTRFLQRLTAEERVEILRQRLKLEGLNAATPIRDSYSSHYWVICEESRVPLDPLDGVVIEELEDPQPWQDRRYISVLSALESGRNSKFQPHVLEKERIKELKASHV